MRLPVVILSALLICILFDASAKERTELHLFKYARINTESSATAFLDFQDLLYEKMPKLASELKGSIDISALDQLMLKLILDDDGKLERPSGSLDGRRKHWKETGALGLLTGYVDEQNNIPFIHTTFFLGDLHGADVQEVIDIEIPVTGEAFDTTNDSHSVATLYALAHEIGKDCKHSASAFYLLSEAGKRSLAVRNDNPELGTYLQGIVEKALVDLKDKCHG